MSARAFLNYWKERYADAPDRGHHDFENVPAEHLQEYNGQEVQYQVVAFTNGDTYSCYGKGTFKVDNSNLLVQGDSNYLSVSMASVGAITWKESHQAYLMCNGKLSIKPLQKKEIQPAAPATNQAV